MNKTEYGEELTNLTDTLKQLESYLHLEEESPEAVIMLQEILAKANQRKKQLESLTGESMQLDNYNPFKEYTNLTEKELADVISITRVYFELIKEKYYNTN